MVPVVAPSMKSLEKVMGRASTGFSIPSPSVSGSFTACTFKVAAPCVKTANQSLPMASSARCVQPRPMSTVSSTSRRPNSVLDVASGLDGLVTLKTSSTSSVSMLGPRPVMVDLLDAEDAVVGQGRQVERGPAGVQADGVKAVAADQPRECQVADGQHVVPFAAEEHVGAAVAGQRVAVP